MPGALTIQFLCFASMLASGFMLFLFLFFLLTTAAKWRDRVNWLVTIGSSMFGSSHSGFFAQNRRPECRPCSRSTRRLGTHGTFGGIRIIGHSFVRFATSMPATTLSSRKNTADSRPQLGHWYPAAPPGALQHAFRPVQIEGGARPSCTAIQRHSEPPPWVRLVTARPG